MPAGIQLYNDAGKLLYDSNVHKVLRLLKVITTNSQDWQFNYSSFSATYSVPGLIPNKHIALPFGDFSGATPLIFTPIIEPNTLRIYDRVGYITALRTNLTVYIMEGI